MGLAYEIEVLGTGLDLSIDTYLLQKRNQNIEYDELLFGQKQKKVKVESQVY